MAIFPFFFLGNIGQENFFIDIVERKNAFLSYKKKSFKFFLIQYLPGKCLFRFSNKKLRFWPIKTTSSKSKKNDILPKWLTPTPTLTLTLTPTPIITLTLTLILTLNLTLPLTLTLNLTLTVTQTLTLWRNHTIAKTPTPTLTLTLTQI